MNDILFKIVRDLGFDLLGVSDGKSLANLEHLLRHRKKIGLESSIEDKDIEKRISPGLHLPGYKSIIALGLSYNFKSKDKGYFPVSKSSQGLDYHLVMERMLKDLMERLKDSIRGDFLPFSDKQALVEREIGVDAGLGFYGKNSSLINPKYGSFIYLGGLITDVEFEPTGRLDMDCGTCDLCQRACPGGALGEEGFNPHRCISYISQKKGALSYDEASLLNSLYGCDICQDVCPFNRSGIEISGDRFLLDEIPLYDPMDILHMSRRAFKEKYGRLAGSWRGVQVLRRNLIILIANKGLWQYQDEINKIKDDNIGVKSGLEYYYLRRKL